MPVEVKAAPFIYYFSGEDYVVEFDEADRFCKEWGGELL